MGLTITPSDMKRGKIVKPGWYDVVITDNKEEANKGGDAVNLVLDFVIEGGPFDGVPLKIWISEKAPAILGVPLAKAFGIPVDENNPLTLDFPEGALKDRKIKAKVETGEYNGRPNNQVVDLAARS